MAAQHSLASKIGFEIDALVVNDVAFKLSDSIGHSFHSRFEIRNWDEDTEFISLIEDKMAGG